MMGFVNSKDGIIGLAIGDAMGLPVKFVERDKLLEHPVVEMQSGGTYEKAKGTWSDSTSLSLATMDSIIHCFGISTEDMGNRFVNWMQNSEYTANDERFEIGRTTYKALSKFEKDRLPFESGLPSEDSNGNGALMRMIPIAYYCYSASLQVKDIYDIVKRTCYITHCHEVSILGCYIYVLFAVKLLEGKSKFDAYKEVQKNGYSQFSRSSIDAYKRVLKQNINELGLDDIKSGGYIVESLEAVLWVILQTENFNQTVIGAINLGNDTDSIGACSAGLAGIIYGLESINPEWRIDLKKYTYIRAMCDEFDKALRSSSKKFDVDKPVLGNEDRIIKIIRGDITKLNVDAYVNSANNSLLGGDGVDGAIHLAAGPKLLEKCRELNGCDTSEAKITFGYNCKAKYIIHTVAPKWYDSHSMDKEDMLKKCYENSYALAMDFGCRRIAFPCIGMGVYGCPVEIGGKIAVDFAVSVARKVDPVVDVIYLVCYGNEEYEFYMKYFEEQVSHKIPNSALRLSNSPG